MLSLPKKKTFYRSYTSKNLTTNFQVDGGKPYHGTSPPGSIGLDIDSNLYVGGVSEEFEER